MILNPFMRKNISSLLIKYYGRTPNLPPHLKFIHLNWIYPPVVILNFTVKLYYGVFNLFSALTLNYTMVNL